MKLRCRAGDLAIITKDEPGCEANIGRMVRVSGSVLERESVGATWLITPVAGAPWSVIEAAPCGGAVACIARTTAQLSGIEHPDRWMVPLRDNPHHASTRGPSTALPMPSLSPQAPHSQDDAAAAHRPARADAGPVRRGGG